MTALEVVSLIASIASLVLAVVAIWLSVVFYKLSTQISESTREASKGIGASVDRLEKLFDKLYADTFSMMRDTVSDMRKHIWPDKSSSDDKLAEEAEKRAEAKVRSLKDEFHEQISEVLRRQKATDGQVSEVASELNRVAEKAIERSRRAETEAREETVRAHILHTLRQMRKERHAVMANDIVERLSVRFPFHVVRDEIERMKKDGMLFYPDSHLGPQSVLTLVEPHK